MRRYTKLEPKAQEIREKGIYITTSGNNIWKHEFYKMPMGNIVQITHKNGLLEEIVNLGR